MDSYRVVYTMGGQQYVYATSESKAEALHALQQAQAEEAPGAKVQELADKWGELEWVDLKDLE